jgi:hypothetical protein
MCDSIQATVQWNFLKIDMAKQQDAQGINPLNSAERARIRIFPFLTKLPVKDEELLVGFVRAALDLGSDVQKAQKYGARASAFETVETLTSADVCVLPFVWDYYLRNGGVAEARKLGEVAKAAGKDIIVWNGGDREGIVPITNAIQFNHGPNCSLARVPRKAFAFPQFKPDWMQTYCDGNARLRPWQPKPVVGFCGWAAWSRLKLLTRMGVSVWRTCQHRLGWSDYVPGPLRSPLLLRGDVLRSLSQDDRIESNFILRDEYRGGIKGGAIDETFSPARLEFINNILDTDYTVCVRGIGNFSARFYETLCLGRIPIFVNTDCILPYDFTLNWRDYCVWVEEDQLGQLPEFLLEFHQRHSGDAFIELQKACRTVWAERLCSEGFYKHFREHLLASGECHKC